VAAAAGTPPPPPPPPPEPSERAGFFTPARLAILALILLALAAVLVFALTRGSSTALVPTVIGKQQADARAILTKAGFTVAIKTFPSKNTPAGIVFEESPPAGERVDKGSTVTLSVSAGVGKAIVPTVAGQPAGQAAKALRDAGLRVKQKRQPSSTVKRGLAIGTTPGAGTKLDRGGVVTLLVSSGRKSVQVPSVIGQQSDVAESQVRQAGLIPNLEARQSNAPQGQVIAQDPAAGSTVKQHSTVAIVFSSGPGTVAVPNVVGESKQAATGDLWAAGLSARIVKRTTTDPTEDDQVVDQSPSAGTQLGRGQTVTIFVGKFKAPPPTTTTTTTPTTPTTTTTTP
jgi:beta-lactam-binding protein with PASTA domain